MFRPRTALGQKRPKLPWLPAAKNTTEQRVKFVPIAVVSGLLNSKKLLRCERRPKRCMVRPCVARDFLVDLLGDGLASMYPASRWSVAPGHHGYQRACDLISG